MKAWIIALIILWFLGGGVLTLYAESLIHVDDHEFNAYETIRITYCNMPGNLTDWITLVPASAPDTQYDEWFYTDGQEEGMFIFPGVEPGTYEIRVYFDWEHTNSYQVQERVTIQVYESNTSALEPCEQWVDSTIPEVLIEFMISDCTFTLSEVSEGIQIPYQVIVQEDVPFVQSQPMDAGNCGTPDLSGFIWMEQVLGNDQSYGIYDVGLCPTYERDFQTISKDSYVYTFEWNGRNWFGPSDFGNPLGDPFPPGRYEFTVSAKGKRMIPTSSEPIHFSVKGTLMIDLIEDEDYR